MSVLRKAIALALLLAAGGVSVARGSGVEPPNTFIRYTPTIAENVNADFKAVKTTVDHDDGRITRNTATLAENSSDIANLKSMVTELHFAMGVLNHQLVTANQVIGDLRRELNAIKDNSVLSLNKHLVLEKDGAGRPTARFRGVNVQVINGTDRQDRINGLGNLIIGYDNPRTASFPVCSDGSYAKQSDCEANGGVWALSHKSGSHNLVAGDGNSYSQYGGVVFGNQNVTNRAYASVGGGHANVASGESSSISGGNRNVAGGTYSSISGGSRNTASGEAASVNGGIRNTAGETHSSIGGGWSNRTSGIASSISGGNQNVAGGTYSSISGGSRNTASGEAASVNGGIRNTAGETHSSIGGGWSNRTSGIASSISGGNQNVAGGTYSSISGGSRNTASGNISSISGGYANTASGTFSSISGGNNNRLIGLYDWQGGTTAPEQKP